MKVVRHVLLIERIIFLSLSTNRPLIKKRTSMKIGDKVRFLSEVGGGIVCAS